MKKIKLSILSLLFLATGLALMPGVSSASSTTVHAATTNLLSDSCHNGLYPTELSDIPEDNQVFYAGDLCLEDTMNNPHYLLMYQTDGNLVMYKVSYPSGALTAVWSSGTIGWVASSMWLQTDGNWVIYRTHDTSSGAIWSTGTGAHPRNDGVMQSDGNWVIYTRVGHVAVFATGAH